MKKLDLPSQAFMTKLRAQVAKPVDTRLMLSEKRTTFSDRKSPPTREEDERYHREYSAEVRRRQKKALARIPVDIATKVW